MAGWVFYQSRRYDRAIEALRRMLEMEPNFGQAYVILALAYWRAAANY